MSVGGESLARQIDLPHPVAAWVLTAHAMTLATPFVLIGVVWHRRVPLVELVSHPSLLLVSAALLLAGSVFEAAQNTEDRWYYTGPAPAFSDAAFTILITAGLAALAVAAHDVWWTQAATLLAVGVALALYRAGHPAFPALGIAGSTSVLALYQALDQPIVLLLLLATGFLNAYFLDGVVRSQAQSLHGAIALSNGLGLLVVAYALEAASRGTRIGWLPIAITSAIVLGTAVAAGPAMRRMSPTPRPSLRQDSGTALRSAAAASPREHT